MKSLLQLTILLLLRLIEIRSLQIKAPSAAKNSLSASLQTKLNILQEELGKQEQQFTNLSNALTSSQYTTNSLFSRLKATERQIKKYSTKDFYLKLSQLKKEKQDEEQRAKQSSREINELKAELKQENEASTQPNNINALEEQLASQKEAFGKSYFRAKALKKQIEGVEDELRDFIKKFIEPLTFKEFQLKKDLNFHYYEQDAINEKYLEKSKEVVQIREALRNLEYELKRQYEIEKKNEENEIEKKNKENEIEKKNKENESDKIPAQIIVNEKTQEIPFLQTDSLSIELKRNVPLIENSPSSKESCSPSKPILRSKPKRVSFSEPISTKQVTQSISKEQNSSFTSDPKNQFISSKPMLAKQKISSESIPAKQNPLSESVLTEESLQANLIEERNFPISQLISEKPLTKEMENLSLNESVEEQSTEQLENNPATIELNKGTFDIKTPILRSTSSQTTAATKEKEKKNGNLVHYIIVGGLAGFTALTSVAVLSIESLKRKFTSSKAFIK